MGMVGGRKYLFSYRTLTIKYPAFREDTGNEHAYALDVGSDLHEMRVPLPRKRYEIFGTGTGRKGRQQSYVTT